MTEQVVVFRYGDLQSCAEAIRADYAVAEDSERRSVQAYRNVGLALLAAKEMCGHGNWLSWLKANVPFTARQAQNYMRLAKCEVTSHLEDAWQVILGNADEVPADEPAREGQTPARAVEVEEREDTSSYFSPNPSRSDGLEPSEAAPVESPRTSGDAVPWSESEVERRAQVEAGGTVVLNMKTDYALYAWAMQCGKFARVDRKTEWGNPYLLDEDGTRDEVCDSYAVYLARKRGLLNRVGELKGRALGCWCFPLRCHADHLADLSEGGVS